MSGLLNISTLNSIPKKFRPATKRQIADRFVRIKLEEHGLSSEGWTHAFNTRCKTVAGWCRAKIKTIDISLCFVEKAEVAEIKDLILHEIAHALCPKCKHNNVWKTTAIRIGGSGKRTHTVQFTKPKYLARCPSGCTYVYRHRKRLRTKCKKCRAGIRYRLVK